MKLATIKLSDYPNITFKESDFVKIEHDTWQGKNYIYGDIELIESLTDWQKMGLMYTASGYGTKIPTHNKVRLNNRLYRVYCHIMSNSGSCYILIKKQRVYLR